MTDVRYQTDNALHSECWDLLPWLANGSLSATQIERVERHVNECSSCAAELRAQQVLRDYVRNDTAVLLAPQAGWQKMTDRLNDEEDKFVRGRVRKRSFVARWAVAAQAVAIVGLLVTLGWQTRPTATMERLSPRYETLTSPATPASNAGDLRIVFRKEVALNEVAELLRTVPAQIVGGPSEAGVYTLARLPGTGTSVPMPELLARLRSDARIVFVEPIRAGQVVQ
ncbi:MAG: zf-HC2 domain-containing protein [Candidatus Obscuribacterales bacterium]|nr:zf-HC2 domain-containing protein [Steroidobacteraceae bacterium]